MHYYQFNIGDYQSHTGHLTELEDLAYRRMLDWLYLHEKPLPLDENEIAKLIRMRTHSESFANVLREFFKKTRQGWHSDRVLKEIQSVNEKSNKARLSAMKRWDTNAMRTHSERNATQDPRPITQDTIKKDTKKKLQTSLTADFILSDDWKIFCHNNRPDLNPEEIFSQFKDYWLSNGDKKADWFATWRNWIRRQKQQLTGETEYQKSMRLRVEEISPNVARKDPAKFVKFTNFVDEVQNVIAIENN